MSSRVMRLVMRCLFCALPAAYFGVVGCTVCLPFGALVFSAAYAFGWQVTEPVASRGETEPAGDDDAAARNAPSDRAAVLADFADLVGNCEVWGDNPEEMRNVTRDGLRKLKSHNVKVSDGGDK